MAREDEIRLIAYSLWEQEACPNGKDCEHWFRAEAMWEDHQGHKPAVIIAKTPAKQVIQKTKKGTVSRKKWH
jgi:hypothetical protein